MQGNAHSEPTLTSCIMQHTQMYGKIQVGHYILWLSDMHDTLQTNYKYYKYV